APHTGDDRRLMHVETGTAGMQHLHAVALLLRSRRRGTRVIEAWYACSGDSGVAVATVRGARKVPGSNLSTGSEAPLHFPSSPPPWRASLPRFHAPGWGRRVHEQLIGRVSSLRRGRGRQASPARRLLLREAASPRGCGRRARAGGRGG